jgi:hypothetical protein
LLTGSHRSQRAKAVGEAKVQRENNRYTFARLELEPHGDLAGSTAGEVRATGRGDFSEARVGDIECRIGEVGVVEDVGEGSLGAQVHSFRNGKDLAEAGGEVDRAWTFHIADARVSEAADGSRAYTDGAGIPGQRSGRVTGVARAGKVRSIEPRIRGASAWDAAAQAIGTLIPSGDNTRAGAGGVGDATGNVGREPGTSLKKEDVAEPPAAQETILPTVHVATEVTPATDWKVVARGGNPALPTGAVDIAVVNAWGRGVGGTTTVLGCEGARVGASVVGQVLGEGVGGVELETVR